MTRSTLGLLVGAGAGIVAAAIGLRAPGSLPSLAPGGFVARVNGAEIRREDYERAVAAVASDRRGQITDDDRRRVLDRLIDEELLIQRGLELGLARFDSTVRAGLTRAVIASIVAEAEDVEPDEPALRAFYETNRDFFTRPGRMRLRQVVVRVPSAETEPEAMSRASRAADRLRAGEDFATVRDEIGGRELAPIPDALLPAEKLLDYLGPTPLRALLALEPGAVSDPVRSGGSLHVLQLLERREPEAPPFEEIRPQVAAELRRRAGEEALRRSLDELRDRAEIEIRAGAP